jgi:hypothetical protein
MIWAAPAARLALLPQPKGFLMHDKAYLERLLKRIASKTKISPNCHEWIGLKDKDGYAIIYDRARDNNERVSRLLWRIKRGPIPCGICILHSCDNPGCVRLSHFFSGTHNENVQDKMQKGRWKGRPKTRATLICQNKKCGKTYEVHAFRKDTSKFCSHPCRRKHYP